MALQDGGTLSYFIGDVRVFLLLFGKRRLGTLYFVFKILSIQFLNP